MRKYVIMGIQGSGKGTHAKMLAADFDLEHVAVGGHHVDKLAAEAQAAQSTDPAAARRLWAQADRIVTDQAPYVPVFNETSAGFVSSRVGNYQESPEYGPLLDQMWVR